MTRKFKCPFCGHEKEIDIEHIHSEGVTQLNKLTLQDIVGYVCEVKEVTHDQMLKRDRHKVVVRAKQLCYYFAYFCTDINLDDIGFYIAESDHATVLHGKNNIVNYLSVPYKDVWYDVELIRYKMIGDGYDIPKISNMMDRYFRMPAFKYRKEDAA